MIALPSTTYHPTAFAQRWLQAVCTLHGMHIARTHTECTPHARRMHAACTPRANRMHMHALGDVHLLRCRLDEGQKAGDTHDRPSRRGSAASPRLARSFYNTCTEPRTRSLSHRILEGGFCTGRLHSAVGPLPSHPTLQKLDEKAARTERWLRRAPRETGTCRSS